MADKTVWDSIKADGDQVIEKLRKLIHEGMSARASRTTAAPSRNFR
jgi:hypothetical protein